MATPSEVVRETRREDAGANAGVRDGIHCHIPRAIVT
jgi:hypothetical protein